jgi:hypothetical protein
MYDYFTLLTRDLQGKERKGHTAADHPVKIFYIEYVSFGSFITGMSTFE